MIPARQGVKAAQGPIRAPSLLVVGLPVNAPAAYCWTGARIVYNGARRNAEEAEGGASPPRLSRQAATRESVPVAAQVVGNQGPTSDLPLEGLLCRARRASLNRRATGSGDLTSCLFLSKYPLPRTALLDLLRVVHRVEIELHVVLVLGDSEPITSSKLLHDLAGLERAHSTEDVLDRHAPEAREVIGPEDVGRSDQVFTVAVLIVVLAILALWGLSGCASMWSSVKSSAAPAGGAAGGAAIGTLAPPFGPIVGAAIGALVVHAVAENAALRSGEIVGEDALTAELRRWRTKAQTAEYAASFAEEGKDWATRWRWRIVWVAVGGFCLLRRKYLLAALTKNGVDSRFWAFAHAFVGADWTRRLAFGYKPMKITKTRKALR